MEAEVIAAEVAGAADGGAKRRQIMDGARTVFFSGGFDGASMNDVARAAGVSKGTLYAYFDSKEQLFEALIREDRGQQAERMCLFPPEPGNPREFLAEFGRRLIEMMTRPEMIAQLRQNYDYVVVDTAPLLSVVDPLVIATLADKILLIIDGSYRHNDSVVEAFRLLRPEVRRLVL